jgi:hypothetical protein
MAAKDIFSGEALPNVIALWRFLGLQGDSLPGITVSSQLLPLQDSE